MQELVGQILSDFSAQIRSHIENKKTRRLLIERAIPTLERLFEDHGWVLDEKEDHSIEPISNVDKNFKFKEYDDGF